MANLPVSTEAPALTPRGAAGVLLATALGYALVGWLALQVVLPPAIASPIYPSAGIALAVTLGYGWIGALGAGIGALLANLVLQAGRGPEWTAAAVALPLVIAFGAAAQALAGAWLARRFAGPKVALAGPRDVARFALWAGAVGCCVSSGIAHVGLVALGSLPTDELPTSLLTWWSGDLLGVMIAAPVVLALIGRPRLDWTGRRVHVVVPMLLGSLLLGLAAWQFHRSEQQRLHDTFDRLATDSISAVEDRLGSARRALQATRDNLAQVSAGTAGAALREASGWWIAQSPELLAIGHARRVARSQVGAFEAEVRAQGNAGYRVFDRPDAPAEVAQDIDVIALDAIEPAAINVAALGVNALSVPAAREAITAAVRTGEAVATRPFRPTQLGPDARGVVVYQPLFRGQPSAPEQRQAALRGVVFVTLWPDAAIRRVLEQRAAGLRWCLADIGPGGQPLAGGAGCDAAPVSFARQHSFQFAGRPWVLRLSARASDLPGSSVGGAWLFTMVGLAATALLGMLLLTVTGRTRKIETAVEQRTHELRAEIHDRRAAEAALRDREQRLRSLFDNVPIGVVFCDLEGRIQDVNPRLCEMLGRSSEDLRRMTLDQFSAPQNTPDAPVWLRRLVDGEMASVRFDRHFQCADGSQLPARLTVTLLRDAEGVPRRLAGVVEDLSGHEQLERSELARAQAEAASHAKSEFVSRMSHELRTPLNAMLGFAQLLGLDKAATLAPHQQAWADQIQRAGWHLLDMINDTLDLARIESGAVEYSLRPLRLRPVVEACCELVAHAAARRQVEVIGAVDAETLAVHADETRLKQILTNLMSNAVKYNRPGGRVQVHAWPLGPDRVAIEVDDNGLGMTDSQLAALFQPFNRLGREGSGVEGTGIGLVISRRLAEAMGGTLEARSQAGQGSTFKLVLPLAQAAAGTHGPRVVDTTMDSGYRQRNVHYVEDNETNVELVRSLLGKRPQVLLEVSTNGLDGLAAIRARLPHLVLLDMNLPDIDGLELLRHLKSSEETASVPVIVISADASRERMAEAMALGAQAYLTKPIDFSSFLRAVDEQLEAAQTGWG